MKVNKSEVDVTLSIGNLSVGQTFTTLRKGRNAKGEKGYYKKVDKFSGICMGLSYHDDLAVNLETGQLRKFNKDDRVTAVLMGCNIIND